jgi:hypothetical protein
MGNGRLVDILWWGRRYAGKEDGGFNKVVPARHANPFAIRQLTSPQRKHYQATPHMFSLIYTTRHRFPSILSFQHCSPAPAVSKLRNDIAVHYTSSATKVLENGAWRASHPKISRFALNHPLHKSSLSP